MLRPIWWQPFYSPSEPAAVLITESWAFPVTVAAVPSTHTFAHGQDEIVEFGHKEVAS